MNIFEKDSCYIANTYARFPVALTSGKGSLVYDENGTKTSYLDKANNIYDNDFKTGDGGFILQSKGLYVLRIVAYDEYYNYVVTEIEFKVK